MTIAYSVIFYRFSETIDYVCDLRGNIGQSELVDVSSDRLEFVRTYLVEGP